MKTYLTLFAALACALALGLICLSTGAVRAQEQPSGEQPAGDSGAQDQQAPAADTAGGPWDVSPDMLNDASLVEPPAAEVSQSTEPVPAGTPSEAPNPLFERPGVQASGERGRDNRISFNFNNASIDSVINVIVRAGNLKLIRTTSLAGNVTITNLDPVTVEEAIDIVDAILHAQGSAFSRQGDVLTIVPFDAAKTGSTPVYQGTVDMAETSLPKGNEMITWVQPLKNADATKVAKDLTPLVSKTGSLTANQTSNTLVIADTGVNVQRLLRIVRQIDAQGSLFDVRIFTLKYADANDVAGVIRQIFAQQTPGGGNVPNAGGPGFMRMRMGGRGGPGGPGGTGGGATDTSGGSAYDTVKVAANTGTNSVIVAATSENLDLIGKMVAQIDTVAAGSPQTIGVFRLENADAQDLSNVLRGILGVQGSTTSAGQQQYQQRRPQNYNTPATTNRGTTNMNVPGRPSNTRPTGGGGTGGGMRGPTGMLEDGPLIYLWPPSSLAASDAGTGGVSPVRSDLGMEVRRAGPLPQAAGAAPGGVSIGQQPLARNSQVVITNDPRTGTVIVSAPVETLALIRSIVEELDRDPAQKYVTQIYHLNNGTAANLANILNSIYNGAATAPIVMGGMAQELQGQITVVPDTVSNSLVITSAPRNFDRIYELVKELDQAPRQVMIQAVLVEVTLNKGSKIGMVDTQFDFNKVLPRREYGFGDTTLFWSVLDQKVNGFMDLLQTQGSVEVLSRPQILASDNKPALINVGQSVPFVTQTQTSSLGNTVNTIQYQDIGILLNVTPHINPEGYVNMDITPQISDFANSTVNVGNGIQAPVFTTRSAQTTVAIQDGQTIVIGGLMTNQDSKTVRKMPILGDIPLLGPLFKHTETSKVKTDLLVIITPKVVASSRGATALSTNERMRSSISSSGKTESQIGSLAIPSDSGPAANAAGWSAPSIESSGVKVFPAAAGPSAPDNGQGSYVPFESQDLSPQDTPAEQPDAEDQTQG